MIEEFGKLGFLPYVEKAVQGPIITTFLYPDTDFDFAQMYRFIKERGYAIYPGKLTDKDPSALERSVRFMRRISCGWHRL